MSKQRPGRVEDRGTGRPRDATSLPDRALRRRGPSIDPGIAHPGAEGANPEYPAKEADGWSEETEARYTVEVVERTVD